MQKSTKEKMGKIKEQIVSISTLVTAIGALLSIFKPLVFYLQLTNNIIYLSNFKYNTKK